MSAVDDKQSDRKTYGLRHFAALFVSLAVGGYVLAIVGGFVTAERRLDTNSVILIVLAVAFVFLLLNPAAIEGLTSITFGGFKAEFAQLRRNQEIQQRQVNSISAVLALLLTEQEQAQLLKLRHGETAQHKGDHELRTLLRKLRGMRLLQMKTDSAGNSLAIATMEDGKVVDLSDFLTMTDLGNRIAEELERIENDRKRLIT